MCWKNIGIIVAHPDDDILGCGGYIATKSHVSVYALYLTYGVGSRLHIDHGINAEIQVRQQEISAANTIIGIERWKCLEYPDQKIENYGQAIIASEIKKWIHGICPHIIFTHSINDLNIDHRITAEAVLVATRYNPIIKAIYGIEIPSSPNLRGFNPRIYAQVNISKKWKALCEYKSETQSFPGGRSERAIAAYAEMRGAEAGLSAAEAFEVYREIID